MTMVRAGLIFVAMTASSWSQHYELADGTQLEASRVVVRGRQLVESVVLPDAKGSVERVHALDSVVRLVWPEPVELAEAVTLLEAGRAAAGASAAESVRRQFDLFARTPGSWWLEATRLQLRALMAAGEEGHAGAAQLARELASVATEPEVIHEAQLALTELEVRSGRIDLAAAMLDTLSSAKVDSRTQAKIWLLRGDVAVASGKHEIAVEAFLRVAVFFSVHEDLLPVARAGALRAFEALGETAQAARLLSESTDALAPAPPRNEPTAEAEAGPLSP